MKDVDGFTPLDMAVLSSNYEASILLVAAGAYPFSEYLKIEDLEIKGISKEVIELLKKAKFHFIMQHFKKFSSVKKSWKSAFPFGEYFQISEYHKKYINLGKRNFNGFNLHHYS